MAGMVGVVDSLDNTETEEEIVSPYGIAQFIFLPGPIFSVQNLEGSNIRETDWNVNNSPQVIERPPNDGISGRNGYEICHYRR